MTTPQYLHLPGISRQGCVYPSCFFTQLQSTENKKGSIREGGTTARRGGAGLSQAQCSEGGAVTRVASALMLFMTAVLRLPVF